MPSRPQDGEEVLTLYWGRLDNGHYYGLLPDGTSLTTATEVGMMASLCCAARRQWRGPLRLSHLA